MGICSIPVALWLRVTVNCGAVSFVNLLKLAPTKMAPTTSETREDEELMAGHGEESLDQLGTRAALYKTTAETSGLEVNNDFEMEAVE